MTETDACFIFERLAALRTELIDRAFVLERRGRIDAADEAIKTSVRLGELYDELSRGVHVSDGLVRQK